MYLIAYLDEEFERRVDVENGSEVLAFRLTVKTELSEAKVFRTYSDFHVLRQTLIGKRVTGFPSTFPAKKLWLGSDAKHLSECRPGFQDFLNYLTESRTALCQRELRSFLEIDHLVLLPYNDNTNEQIMEFKCGMVVGTHSHMLTKYQNSFKGSDAVKWMVGKVRDVLDQLDAINLGQTMVQRGVVYNAVDKWQPFLDEGSELYYFNPFYDFSGQTAAAVCELYPFQRDEGGSKKFSDYIRVLKNSVDLQTKQFLFSAYENCFEGSQASRWIRTVWPNVRSDAEAVQQGSTLLSLGVFLHVADREAGFLDSDEALYQFNPFFITPRSRTLPKVAAPSKRSRANSGAKKRAADIPEEDDFIESRLGGSSRTTPGASADASADVSPAGSPPRPVVRVSVLREGYLARTASLGAGAAGSLTPTKGGQQAFSATTAAPPLAPGAAPASAPEPAPAPSPPEPIAIVHSAAVSVPNKAQDSPTATGTTPVFALSLNSDHASPPLPSPVPAPAQRANPSAPAIPRRVSQTPRGGDERENLSPPAWGGAVGGASPATSADSIGAAATPPENSPPAPAPVLGRTSPPSRSPEPIAPAPAGESVSTSGLSALATSLRGASPVPSMARTGSGLSVAASVPNPARVPPAEAPKSLFAPVPAKSPFAAAAEPPSPTMPTSVSPLAPAAAPPAPAVPTRPASTATGRVASATDLVGRPTAIPGRPVSIANAVVDRDAEWDVARTPYAARLVGQYPPTRPPVGVTKAPAKTAAEPAPAPALAPAAPTSPKRLRRAGSASTDEERSSPGASPTSSPRGSPRHLRHPAIAAPEGEAAAEAPAPESAVPPRADPAPIPIAKPKSDGLSKDDILMAIGATPPAASSWNRGGQSPAKAPTRLDKGSLIRAILAEPPGPVEPEPEEEIVERKKRKKRKPAAVEIGPADDGRKKGKQLTQQPSNPSLPAAPGAPEDVVFEAKRNTAPVTRSAGYIPTVRLRGWVGVLLPSSQGDGQMKRRWAQVVGDHLYFWRTKSKSNVPATALSYLDLSIPRVTIERNEEGEIKHSLTITIRDDEHKIGFADKPQREQWYDGIVRLVDALSNLAKEQAAADAANQATGRARTSSFGSGGQTTVGGRERTRSVGGEGRPSQPIASIHGTPPARVTGVDATTRVSALVTPPTTFDGPSGRSDDSESNDSEEEAGTTVIPTTWCSWCYKQCSFSLVEKNYLQRDLYLCAGCKRCGRLCQRCGTAMAQTDAGHSDMLCAKCDNTIADWGIVPPRKVYGWCSWCLEHHQMMVVHTNPPRRSVHACCGCGKRTLPCRSCRADGDTAGYAKGHPGYDDELCSLCDHTIPDWGRGATSARDLSLDGWCSWCLERSTHAMLEQNIVRRSTYTCQDCGSRTLPCIECRLGMARSAGGSWDESHCVLCHGGAVLGNSWEELTRVKDAVFKRSRDKQYVVCELERSSEMRRDAEKAGMIRPFLLLVSMPPRRRNHIASLLGFSLVETKFFGDPHQEAWFIISKAAGGMQALARTAWESFRGAAVPWYHVLYRVCKTVFGECSFPELDSDDAMTSSANPSATLMEEDLLARVYSCQSAFGVDADAADEAMAARGGVASPTKDDVPPGVKDIGNVLLRNGALCDPTLVRTAARCIYQTFGLSTPSLPTAPGEVPPSPGAAQGNVFAYLADVDSGQGPAVPSFPRSGSTTNFAAGEAPSRAVLPLVVVGERRVDEMMVLTSGDVTRWIAHGTGGVQRQYFSSDLGRLFGPVMITLNQRLLLAVSGVRLEDYY